MAKKQYFILIDTETTIKDNVADFGAAVVDRKGEIHAQCAVLVHGFYGSEELFHDPKANDVWGWAGLEKRKTAYSSMLENGSRTLASVNAINRWLEKAAGKYDPELSAYNLPFDVSKCQNSGIALEMFTRRFCLWQAAVGTICDTRGYKEFVLENHLFNRPTEKGNMTFLTNAEAVAGYVNQKMTIEPHTAIEDIIGFEIPILQKVLTKRDWRDKMLSYNWRNWQVKDHFKVK